MREVQMLSNVIRAGLGLSAIIGLSACEPLIEVTAPQVQAGYLAGFDQERVARTRTVIIRSYTGTDSSRAEFSGAQCELLSSEISARFVTPAQVVLPAFVQHRDLPNRGRPSNLRISCTANGKTGVETFTAEDKRVTTSTNTGIAGAIISTMLSGAIASSSPWEYPFQMVIEVSDISQ